MDEVNVSASQIQLLDFVRIKREALSRVSFEPRKPSPFPNADRWMLASLLQKAIRRSDIDVARRAGHQLLITDPGRLWRRLMVVGLEDIGIGDVETASFMVAMGGLAQPRALWRSPACALDAALYAACDAAKERSGDVFGSIAREMAREAGHSLEALPQTAKLAVLSYGYLPWRRRLRAAFLLGREGAPAEIRKAEFGAMAEIFRAAGVPELLLSACLIYRGKSDDLLPLYVPLAYILWRDQGGVMCISNASCSSPLIETVPAYGFDPLHTRLGRRAIDVWVKSYLVPPPFSASQVAIAQWNMESAACRKAMHWQLTGEIREHGQSADLLNRGLPAQRHEEIINWVCAQQPILQQARRAVWDVANAAIPGASCENILEQKGNDNDE